MIGCLISICTGLNEKNQEFNSRYDEATTLIGHFREENEIHLKSDTHENREIVVGKKKLAKRIRKYIYEQHVLSSRMHCVNEIEHHYPVLQTLPPGLQEQASILLYRHFLDSIPYLSSECLSMKEQATVALQVVHLEFPAGELIYLNKGVHSKGYEPLGRGVYYIEFGCAKYRKQANSPFHFIAAGNVAGLSRVLLEDGHRCTKGTRLSFLSYSKVLFIPRHVIMSVLERNQKAWKECGRWVYARTVLSHFDEDWSKRLLANMRRAVVTVDE